jgi:hypothetical protein
VNISVRLISLAAIVLFLSACYFAGYVNVVLKGAIGDVERGALLIGFLMGAGTAARYVRDGGLAWLLNRRDKRRHSRVAKTS